MPAAVPPPSIRPDRNRDLRIRRQEVIRFQAWQRDTRPGTAPLVRLVRILAREHVPGSAASATFLV